MDCNEQLADDPLNNDRICAVIVAYQPDLEVIQQQIQALSTQINDLCVVDNASTNQLQLKDLLSKDFPSACLIANTDNLGIAVAQNQGIEKARQSACDFVLILDQDSIPDPDMVAYLKSSFAALKDKKVSAIGASYAQHGELSNFVRFSWGRFTRIPFSKTRPLLQTDFLISSGALIPLSVIDEVGAMEAGLFIDHVDTEWFLRAASKGYRSYGHCLAKMSHCLGERSERLWLGRWRHVPIHKPFRYYYIFRNSILLYKRHYTPWQWKIADMVRLSMMFAMFGLLSKSRVQNLKMIWRGLIDGIKNRSGRIDD